MSDSRNNAKNSQSSEQSLSLIRYAVTFLIGSGGAGAAMALIGKEGFQMYGVGALLICIFASLVFIFILLRHEDRTRRETINNFNDFYVLSMKTVGEYLVRGPDEDMSPERVLRSVARDIRNQGQEQKGDQVLVRQFQAGMNEIADKWEDLAAKGRPEDIPPKQES
jgi:hypothetical protein